ncbi:PH domain-containing protein [Streptomyces sp. NBC_01317]|uniref:PH domain-containing protein n=1 Tax=Streptomyces sp. NBC_01317 TaxID=2903822 RepID=UPI002E1282A8|nr:PH domain-containing protein [Streptomyces sp. NBC_01317]
MTSTDQPSEPTYADRVYRSSGGIAGGVMLLLLSVWLGGDALINGTGRTPWLALAGLLLVVPLVIAFTLRPAVFAGEDRLRIRNPFRLITVEWSAVKDIRAGYSCEVFTEDAGKYQLWAVPVSLRQRKRVARRQSRQAHDDPHNMTSVTADVNDTGARMAQADRTVVELRDLAERGVLRGAGEAVAARWAYEVIAPAVAGLVVLVVLLSTG